MAASPPWMPTPPSARVAIGTKGLDDDDPVFLWRLDSPG
jgi:hypothetical protein